jgi:hypothetical protein
MKRALLAVAIVVLYALHQDVWNWGAARPFLFGFLPKGLAYHAAYSVAASGLLWALVTWAWPAHLDEPSLPPSAAPRPAGRDDAAAGPARS